VSEDKGPTAESILAEAQRMSLPLTPEEAAELVKGVSRMQEMARNVRTLISDATEPAPSFDAAWKRGQL
jgi:hypothetical protein